MDAVVGILGVGNEMYVIAFHYLTEDMMVEVPSETEFPAFLKGEDIRTPVANGAEDWHLTSKGLGCKCIFVCPLSMDDIYLGDIARDEAAKLVGEGQWGEGAESVAADITRDDIYVEMG